MLRRLETMVLMGCDLPTRAIRSQIASAIDVLVHLERARDGKRRVVSIVEVEEYDEDYDKIRLRTLFGFEECEHESGMFDGKLVRKNELLHKEKLAKAGYLQIESQRDPAGSVEGTNS